MSHLACTYCEAEWNLDPLSDEEGNPFCCEECMISYWADDLKMIPVGIRPIRFPAEDPGPWMPQPLAQPANPG